MPDVLEPSTIPTPHIGDETRSTGDLAPTFFVICWNEVDFRYHQLIHAAGYFEWKMVEDAVEKRKTRGKN